MKKILMLALIAVMMISITGCGENINNAGTGKDEQISNNSDEVSWSDNEYTKLVPKPEEAVIYSEKAIDNVYYLGHQITLEN